MSSRRRPVHSFALLATLGLLALAGCGSGGSASPSPAPATPPPTATPSPEPSVAPPPTPDPTPAPTAFVSYAYDYEFAVPEGWSATPASMPWDGVARIDSDGPYTDRFYGPDSELFFVYGGATTMDLDAYAADQQAKVSEWHGCPAEAEVASDQQLIDYVGDPVPARLHEFGCQGLYVFKLMAVNGGNGLVVNQLTPPTDVEAMRAAFLGRVAGLQWGVATP